MSSLTISSENQLSSERIVWESLKEAISSSSGFECWQQQRTENSPDKQTTLDYEIRRYLRETLETLAY